jgi:hypothetical protein
MVYVVEIERRDGARAVKEYETKTVRDLAKAIYRDLRAFPAFRVTRAWRKEQPEKRVLP